MKEVEKRVNKGQKMCSFEIKAPSSICDSFFGFYPTVPEGTKNVSISNKDLFN